LDQRVSDVEDMVSLRLDISRNELLVASTVLSVFACTIGFAGFITGAFGMNLDNSEELSAIRGLFGGVFGGCILIIIVSTVSVLQYFRAKGILPTHTSVRWANVEQIIQQKNA
jgi:Mg2+ and Co2+ transporter CorA